MPLHWRAWQAIAQRHRLNFPEERFYELGGVPTRDILKMLAQEQGVPIDHLAVAHEKENEYLPLLHQVEPVNAVVGVAREHYGKIPMAVASGGTKKIITQVLEHLGIVKLFDAIVTSDLGAARRFAAAVDSSAVMVNASTRFNDGYELGLGAEIGISTDKFHARGPCGLLELTSYKYVVYGDGQVRG